MDDALADLRIADTRIKTEHRYPCGLEPEAVPNEYGRLFFQSPDGQNGELFYRLLNMGYTETKYYAPYYWEVQKAGWRIEYVEGDVYIRPVVSSAHDTGTPPVRPSAPTDGSPEPRTTTG